MSYPEKCVNYHKYNSQQNSFKGPKYPNSPKNAKSNIKFQNMPKMTPKSTTLQDDSRSWQNSKKFCRDFTRDRIFFIQTLFAHLYVFASLIISLRNKSWKISRNCDAFVISGAILLYNGLFLHCTLKIRVMNYSIKYALVFWGWKKLLIIKFHVDQHLWTGGESVEWGWSKGSDQVINSKYDFRRNNCWKKKHIKILYWNLNVLQLLLRPY